MNTPSACNLCQMANCERVGHEEKLHQFYTYILAEEELTNAQRRFQSYMNWTTLQHGVLGKGNRIPIPNCVKTEIEKWFPRDNGDYGVGFKTA